MKNINIKPLDGIEQDRCLCWSQVTHSDLECDLEPKESDEDMEDGASKG